MQLIESVTKGTVFSTGHIACIFHLTFLLRSFTRVQTSLLLELVERLSEFFISSLALFSI